MRAMKWLLIGLLLAIGCGQKPSEENCRKAIANINRINGIDDAAHADQVEPAVRKCRGESTRAAVDCMIAAKTQEDVDACLKK